MCKSRRGNATFNRRSLIWRLLNVFGAKREAADRRSSDRNTGPHSEPQRDNHSCFCLTFSSTYHETIISFEEERSLYSVVRMAAEHFLGNNTSNVILNSLVEKEKWPSETSLHKSGDSAAAGGVPPCWQTRSSGSSLQAVWPPDDCRTFQQHK